MVHFKKLQLSGFKSFVDPTDLLILPGVTAVVGPNGCGKSNLIEGLRWVMGENSAKRMRGGEMDDVIFAGNVTRPARNVAEVMVELDNHDRKAPAIFNETDSLQIVRRIDRGQGSSYSINGKDVRARDVQLLFADSATGAQSTALVSQGRVGALINAKPKDRRSLLEEAAGITGLHSRRHEAELRLRAAETNLERLDDVISTLETQLQGLKKQARQATRYRNIADQIRRTDALALHLEAEAGKALVAAAKEKLQELEAAVAEATREAGARAEAQAEAAAALPELRRRESAAAAALQKLLIERDALEREEAQTAETQRQATERLEVLGRDRARAQGLAEEATGALAQLAAESAQLAERAAQEESQIGEARAAFEAARQAVLDQEASSDDLARKLAAEDASAKALQQRLGELNRRLEKLGREAAQADEQLSLLASGQAERAALAQSDRRIVALEGDLEAARSAQSQAEADAEALSGALAGLQDAAAQKDAALSRLEAEAAALTALLEPSDRGNAPPLIQSLKVAPGYEKALGIALGDDLSLSCDPSDDLYWQTLAPYHTTTPLPQGVESLADRVQGPHALARRLSQIGVVDDEDRGAALQSALLPGQRLVTRGGALWRWDGFTARAKARSSAAKRLEQKNRLEELQRLLVDARAEAESTQERRDEAKQKANDAKDILRQARSKLDDAMSTLNRERQEHSRLTREISAIESRRAALEESASRIAKDLAESADAKEAAQKEAAAQKDLEELRAEAARSREDLARLRIRQNDCQGVLNELLAESRERRSRLASIEQDQERWQRRGTEAQHHIAELEKRQADLEAELAELAKLPALLAERREKLSEGVDAAEARRKGEADALAAGESAQRAADQALKSAEQALAACREDRVRAEASLAQAEQALETTREKAQERLNAKLESLFELAEHKPDQALPPRADVERKLERLVRERDNMGPVNLRADLEAKAMEEQIDNLQTERDDLIAAIQRLRQAIASLNKEGRERLLTAFEEVNKHFSDLFTRLFGGGSAHLELTQADDPLDAGLEIMASPPGKRLQIMSLLSGGEQALTALSLLFAVFLTNPAPICVLDEVDAPLDDANVDRFCTLLDELAHSTSTRFLIITHHRLTMARADRLFGVTMAERGVSRLVSVDLSSAEELRKTA